MIGDLAHHNAHRDSVTDWTMSRWKEESDRIVLGATYEMFLSTGHMECVVARRVNFYSFEVVCPGGISRIVPIESFKRYHYEGSLRK